MLTDLTDMNLDAMEPTELDELADNLKSVARYADLKSFAMRERAAGRIRGAQIAETQLEVLRLDIPAEWRW